MYTINYTDQNGHLMSAKIDKELGEKFMNDYNKAKSTDLVVIPTKGIRVQKRAISSVTFGHDEQPGFNEKEVRPAYDDRPVFDRCIQWMSQREMYPFAKTLEVLDEYGEYVVSEAGAYMRKNNLFQATYKTLKELCKRLSANRPPNTRNFTNEWLTGEIQRLDADKRIAGYTDPRVNIYKSMLSRGEKFTYPDGDTSLPIK